MGIDFCNDTERLNLMQLFGTKRDMDIKPLYTYLCPVIIFICFFSIIFNAILISISRQSKVVNKSPILLLSLNLAVTDLIASLLNGLSILFNSYLPEVYDIKMGQCSMLMFEVVRCAALVASALHLLALAFVHYRGIVNPLHYRSTIFFSQHLSRTINIVSIACWIIPLTIMIAWFSSSPCQGFQSAECDYLFLLGFTFRYMVLTLFALPLILMSVIYLRIFIIISRHQKGRRLNHERSTLKRGVISATGPTCAAATAVNLPELMGSRNDGDGTTTRCAYCAAKALHDEEEPTVAILGSSNSNSNSKRATMVEFDDEGRLDSASHRTCSPKTDYYNPDSTPISDSRTPSIRRQRQRQHQSKAGSVSNWSQSSISRGSLSGLLQKSNSASGTQTTKGDDDDSESSESNSLSSNNGGEDSYGGSPSNGGRGDKSAQQSQLAKKKQSIATIDDDHKALVSRTTSGTSSSSVTAVAAPSGRCCSALVGNQYSSRAQNYIATKTSLNNDCDIENGKSHEHANSPYYQQQSTDEGVPLTRNSKQLQQASIIGSENFKKSFNGRIKTRAEVGDGNCKTSTEVTTTTTVRTVALSKVARPLAEKDAQRTVPLLDSKDNNDSDDLQLEGNFNKRKGGSCKSSTSDGVKVRQKAALRAQFSSDPPTMTTCKGQQNQSSGNKEVKLLTLPAIRDGGGRLPKRALNRAEQTSSPLDQQRSEIQTSSRLYKQHQKESLVFGDSTPNWECTCDIKLRQFNTKLSRSNTVGDSASQTTASAATNRIMLSTSTSHRSSISSSSAAQQSLKSQHLRRSPTTMSGDQSFQQDFRSTSAATANIAPTSNNNNNINSSFATTNLTVTAASSTYEPQRRHFHSSAVPQTNTKALVTTLLILGTYFISYVPAIIYQVLTCIDDCPYPLYNLSFSRRVLLGAMTTLLLIAKSIIDPFIYSYRMSEIQLAITRYLSKRRISKSSHAVSMHYTSQRINATGTSSQTTNKLSTNNASHHHHHNNRQLSQHKNQHNFNTDHVNQTNSSFNIISMDKTIVGETPKQTQDLSQTNDAVTH